MTIILTYIIVILLVVIFFQYRIERARNQELMYINVAMKNVMEEHNTSQKLLLVTNDQNLQTLLHNINCLLEQNQNILVEHSRLKDSMKKMLSNISHDLKTPLTVVTGYIETITHENKFTVSDHRLSPSGLIYTPAEASN